MTSREAVIHNEMGIHCRPSAIILKEVKPYAGSVEVETSAGRTPVRSVMDLLGLGLEKGTLVKIRVEGPAEEAMADRLRDLFETDFDFAPLS